MTAEQGTSRWRKWKAKRRCRPLLIEWFAEQGKRANGEIIPPQRR